MLNDKDTREFFAITLLLVVFAITVVINTKTPMIGEDYTLSITYHEKISFSIFNKLGLIYGKVRHQFSHWNSRIGEQLSILFLGFDKTFFNVINSLVFVCLAALNVRFGLGDLSLISTAKLITYISFILMIYYVFFPALGESVFWLTGSTNYLWGLVLLVIFLIPFLRLYETPTEVKSVLPIYYLVIGFFSGMTNENTVPVSIMFCFLCIFMLMYKKVSVHYSYFLGIFFHLMGYFVLIFSPSTKIRREYYNQVYGVKELVASDYLGRFAKIVKDFYLYYKYFLLAAILLLALFIVLNLLYKKYKVLTSYSRFKNLFFFVIISFGSVVDMIAVPYFEIRSSLLVFFAITSLLIYVVDKIYLLRRPLFYFGFLSLSLTWLFTINTMRIYYNTFDFEFNNREAFLFTNMGLKKTVVVTKFPVFEDRRLLDTRESYLIFANHNYSKYYGFDKIEIK